MTNEPQTQPRDAFLRTVAVLGLIAVLLLGAWGIITLAVNLPGIFNYIGGGFSSTLLPSQTETLTVMATPSSVASGQSVEISWAHKNQNGQYSYDLSYSCGSGISVKAPTPTGAYSAVACDTPFNYVTATQHMLLIPTLGSGNQAALVITVSATNLATGVITAQGTTTVTVTNSAGATTQKTSTAASKTNYYPAAKAAASLYGYADLAVIINSVTPSGSLESVTFTIENTGTNRVPAGWTFNAVLPVQGSYTFNSQAQRALNPGDKVVYTLSFERPANTGYGYNYGTTGCGSNYGINYNCGTTPYYQYPNQNYPYTCNNYGPCNIPGYVNLYPYGSPYQNYYGNSGLPGQSYCPPGYSCSAPFGTTGYGGASIGTVTITADPYNLVTESNKANNTATAQAY